MSFASLLASGRAPHNAIDISEEAGVRYLHFGTEWVQGAMRVARPFALELEYTREMMLPLLLAADYARPAQVLVIGLGAASLVKFLHRYCPQACLTVVEIDARMPGVATSYFRLPKEDARLNIVIDDGADFVARDERAWDLILVDGYDHKARANTLDSVRFHQDCCAHLAAGGFACLNLFGRLRGFRASAKRLREGYEGRTLVLPSLDEGNAVCIGTAEAGVEVPFDVLRERARILRSQTGLNLAPTLSRLEKAGFNRHGKLFMGDGRMSAT